MGTNKRVRLLVSRYHFDSDLAEGCLEMGNWRTLGESLKPVACPDCQRDVYFVKHGGGGTFFNRLGRPWPKHACTNRPKPYTPFNRSGRPKLRNRRSAFEKKPWLPLIIQNIQVVSDLTIVRAVSLNVPTNLCFQIPAELQIDRARMAYFRPILEGARLVELSVCLIGEITPILINATEYSDDAD